MFNKFASNLTRVDFGVPQGGDILLILLLLFVNDLEHYSNSAGCFLYARDTIFNVPSPGCQDVFNTPNTVPADYTRWFQ